jgi:hypothetical protein
LVFLAGDSRRNCFDPAAGGYQKATQCRSKESIYTEVELENGHYFEKKLPNKKK